MKKLSIVSLLIVVFSVTAVAANAKPSAPFYLVSMGQPCRLPDGAARPQETTESKVQTTDVAENIVQVNCVGALPPGAVLPRYPIKLTYYETKIPCVTRYGEDTLLSQAYAATVLPNGTSEISCVFHIH
ncbi:MAG: hypothetical protein WAV79_04745 [Anaerolineae bacterium]|uniref:hypothetical protein n=1 Tax=Candidatus Amarolinea dominans TaxID=3140696 RepID=UPI00313605DF|nr:hypothetical protein [Anaerolineae bacterium]